LLDSSQGAFSALTFQFRDWPILIDSSGDQ
jgi:hypothetical protein